MVKELKSLADLGSFEMVARPRGKMCSKAHGLLKERGIQMELLRNIRPDFV